MRISLFLLLLLLIGYSNCGRRITLQPDLGRQYFSAEQYPPEAVSILPDGKVLRTPAAISEYRQQTTGTYPMSKRTLAEFTIGRDQEYAYAIRSYTDAANNDFAHLQVLDQKTDTPRRALEFIVPYDFPFADTTEITAARMRWMRYCNDHQVEELIKNCYAEQTLYYNHRPLLQGRAALIEEYAYMKNPAYQLTLTPLHVESVSEEFVLELGQCSGSYGGRYLIVWQRGGDGVWRVFLDGNL